MAKKRNKKDKRPLLVREMSTRHYHKVEKTPYVTDGVKFYKIKKNGIMLRVDHCLVMEKRRQ